MTKLDAERRRELLSLSRAGMDSRTLALRFGVSRSTVNRVLRSERAAETPEARAVIPPEPVSEAPPEPVSEAPPEPAAPPPPGPIPEAPPEPVFEAEPCLEPDTPPYDLDEDLTARMLACRHKVYAVMDLYLDALLDLERFGKVSPNQLTGALGTLLDKWGALEAESARTDGEAGGVIILGEVEEDPSTSSA